MRATDQTVPDLAAGGPIPLPRVVLTVEQAADALGIGRILMYELVGTGAVESVRIGRLRRIPTEALWDYVEGLRSTSEGGGS
jgi:excisionase family DNA binding protein